MVSKATHTATDETQILIGFINYDRLLYTGVFALNLIKCSTLIIIFLGGLFILIFGY